MNDQQLREANVARFRSVVEKMSTARSLDTVEDITEDFEFELPYGPGGQPLKVAGKEAWREMNATTWAMFEGEHIVLEVTRVHEMLSPNTLIAEYRSNGKVKHTGKPYENRYIGVFEFRDGLICRWTEFHNPEITMAAMTPDETAAVS